MSNDEISLKEAAELAPKPPLARPARPPFDTHDDDPEAKRARETGNAGATLDAMLAASRHNRTVRGQG